MLQKKTIPGCITNTLCPSDGRMYPSPTILLSTDSIDI